MDDAALDVISHCAPLEFLELVNCRRISDAGIIALLRGQPAVRALLLGGCTGLTDTTCHALAGLRELEDLRLVRCEALTDEGVAAVGQIVSLEHLNLNDSTGVGSKTVRAVAHLPRLRELRLAGTAPISDEALRELGEAQTLEALSLAEHRNIGAAGLFEICGLERLVELGLRHCLNLVDDALAELARRPTLRVLDVAGCTQLSRAGLAHLARITTLCELGLAYAPSVNDETVELLTSLKELVVLSVAYCPALTSAGLAKLAALPALKQVDVRQTLGFGPSEVGSLRARRPGNARDQDLRAAVRLAELDLHPPERHRRDGRPHLVRRAGTPQVRLEKNLVSQSLETIPNNVDLGSDRRLQRALEQWQPNFLSWWRDVGPEGFQQHDVYLRTAISVEPDGWANFGYVRMPDYRWGIFLAPAEADRKIGFGDLMHQGYVGVVQSGDRHRVVLEFLHPLRIRGDSRVQRLEDDLLGGLVVSGLIQNPGSVLTKLGMDGVVRDCPTYQRVRFVRGCFRVLNHG